MPLNDPPALRHLLEYVASFKRSATGGGARPPKGQWLDGGVLPMLPDQYAYVLDYHENRVAMARGFGEVLGYPDHAVDMRLVFAIIHPDDLPIVTQIVERAVRTMFQTHPADRPFASVLSLDHRVRKANGEYIKVVRQITVAEVDDEADTVRSTLSIGKDITSIKTSDRIGWQCSGEAACAMDMSDIIAAHDNLVYRPTSREMDIIRKMALGMNSGSIAEELFISTHTVNNHRRNLLQRTGMKNSAELVRRCADMGWI